MTLHDADRDPSADPGTDFYRWANGGWIDANVIPPGYGAWGAFEELSKRNETVLHDLLLHAAESPTNDLDRMLGDYFTAGMDVDAVEAAGLTAIAPHLGAIAEVTSYAEVLALLPALHSTGLVAFFGFGVTVDHDDSTKHLLWLVQSGLGLPDRDSYDSDTEANVSLRAAYVDHVAAQLVNAGADAADAPGLAASVLALETALAAHQMRAEDRRDPRNTLNRHDLAALHDLAPELDLPRYLAAIGADGVETVNVQAPAYFAALHGVIAGTDVATLRAYLTFHVVRTVADALPAAVSDESFEFYGRRIEGKQAQKERYQRVVAALGQDMGEALGHRFVDERFPPRAKDRARQMVDEIVHEMRHSLETRSWMSESTRTQAIEKLDAFEVKIGYPDVWRDWSALPVVATSYAANRLAAARFENDRQVGQLTEPVDRTEWEMPPHVVNAYYHPVRNEIVFPAGILQPPFFDADADDAVNFGGIGTVIAHEITHGFDDAGSRFDGAGRFRDWWTAEDREHFTALADRLVTQFDDYVAVGDVHVNGRLTLGENIADLGGVALSSRAHARTSAGSPDIDGLTPAQRFFTAAATVWRGIESEELARTLAQVDSHSPRRFRARGPLSNMDEFQEAFGLTDDAPMLRPREDRIEIW
jgi:predicted metalloendopeptidase